MPTTELETLQNFVGDPLRQIVAHLAKNPIAGDVDEYNLADLVECDFPGYAPIPLTHYTPMGDNNNDCAGLIADICSWVAGAIVTPQIPTLVYLTIKYDTGTPQLWRQFLVDPQVTMRKAGDHIDQQVTILSVDLE